MWATTPADDTDCQALACRRQSVVRCTMQTQPRIRCTSILRVKHCGNLQVLTVAPTLVYLAVGRGAVRTCSAQLCWKKKRNCKSRSCWGRGRQPSARSYKSCRPHRQRLIKPQPDGLRDHTLLGHLLSTVAHLCVRVSMPAAEQLLHDKPCKQNDNLLAVGSSC